MRKILYFVFVFLVLASGFYLFHVQKLENNSSTEVKNLFVDTAVADEQITISRRTAIVTATERVKEAVVSITVIGTRLVAGRNPLFEDPFFDFFRDFFPPYYYKQRVVSLGSGVIISPDGYIITNEHVVEGGDTVKVTLPDGRNFDGEIVGIDKRHDIALIKIHGQSLPYAKLGNSDDLYIGEWAIAIGNPLGFLMEDVDPTVTVGVISAVHRTIKGRGERVYRDMIQTDAAINPGNSGGALVNSLGEVIGINTFILSQSGGSEGLGFAIPINTVKKIVNELRKYGYVREAYIGVICQDLTKKLASTLGYNKSYGIFVTDVYDKSVKLREGDIIEKVNGRKIFNLGDWEDFTYAVLPGERLKILIYRNGKEKLIDVVAKELHMDHVYIKDFGMYLSTLTDPLRVIYSINHEEGVFVEEVKPGSLGQRLGFIKGDVIYRINRKNIANVEEFKNMLKNTTRGGLVFFIERKGENFILEIR